MSTSPKVIAVDHPGDLPSGKSDAGNDADLVRLLRVGDEAAFASLVDRYHRTLLRLALVFVRTQENAEEVVQDVWMGVLRGLDSFEQRSSLKTWIFRILFNRAKTRAVQDGRTLAFSTLEREDDTGPAVDPSRFKPDGMWAQPPRPWTDDTPEKLLLRREALALVEQTIDDLPPRQRAIILLRDVEGESAEDVCNILEISETNQRVLLHRARMGVRRVLEQYLGEDPK
ncbi:MAG: RNA polymerase sigma factor [Polyangiaceae bacterium]